MSSPCLFKVDSIKKHPPNQGGVCHGSCGKAFSAQAQKAGSKLLGVHFSLGPYADLTKRSSIEKKNGKPMKNTGCFIGCFIGILIIYSWFMK